VVLEVFLGASRPCRLSKDNAIHNQVFQGWEFPIECLDKLLQILNREVKAEAADAMTLLEGKQYPLFIFCSDAIFTGAID
jgi:hypothetical protein